KRECKSRLGYSSFLLLLSQSGRRDSRHERLKNGGSQRCLRRAELERALSRHRISRVFRAVGWPHSWSVNNLVGQTRRVAGNRRAWKGIAQFPDLDVNL